MPRATSYRRSTATRYMVYLRAASAVTAESGCAFCESVRERGREGGDGGREGRRWREGGREKESKGVSEGVQGKRGREKKER